MRRSSFLLLHGLLTAALAAGCADRPATPVSAGVSGQVPAAPGGVEPPANRPADGQAPSPGPGPDPGPTPQTPPGLDLLPGIIYNNGGGVATGEVGRVLGTVSAPVEIVSADGQKLLSNNGQILYNNGGGIIYNNGGGIIYNNGGGIIYNNGGGYRVAAASTGDRGLANALLYLTDRDERFFIDRAREQVYATLTDAQGRYAFAADENFPMGKDVVVNAVVDSTYRLTGYLVPGREDVTVNLSLATTLATEYLRGEAYRHHRRFSDYDQALFQQAVALTDSAIRSGAIEAVRETTDAEGRPRLVGVFDLRISQVQALRNQYVTAISRFGEGDALLAQLSDTWTALLGYRPTAVETLAGNGAQPEVRTSPAERGFQTGDSRYGASPPLHELPLGRPQGLAVSARGDIFLSGDGENAKDTFIRWLKPRPGGGYEVSSIWLPEPIAFGGAMAVERQPVDEPGAGNPPGTLILADDLSDKVYRVPIVDRQAVDPVTGAPRWPIEYVAGWDFPVHGVFMDADPHHPVHVDLFDTDAWDPFAPFNRQGEIASDSSWRLADEGPRTYRRGNLDLWYHYHSKDGFVFGLPADWLHAAGSALFPNAARYARLRTPRAVTTDELGNIYIADTGNYRVRLIPSAEAIAQAPTMFGYRTPVDAAPSDGVIDGFGAEAPMQAGAIYTIVGNPPWDPAGTPDDRLGHWLPAYADNEGAPAQEARLGRPEGLAFRQGTLYVADGDHGIVWAVSRATGRMARVAGVAPGEAGFTGEDGAPHPAKASRFARLRGITFDGAGRLVAVDEASGQLRRLDAGGNLQTVAGLYHRPGSPLTDHFTDGDARAWVDLYETTGVAADADGRIVFADRRHGRVRKLWRPVD